MVAHHLSAWKGLILRRLPPLPLQLGLLTLQFDASRCPVSQRVLQLTVLAVRRLRVPFFRLAPIAAVRVRVTPTLLAMGVSPLDNRHAVPAVPLGAPGLRPARLSPVLLRLSLGLLHVGALQQLGGHLVQVANHVRGGHIAALPLLGQVLQHFPGTHVEPRPEHLLAVVWRWWRWVTYAKETHNNLNQSTPRFRSPQLADARASPILLFN